MRLSTPLQLTGTLLGVILLGSAHPCRAQSAGVNQGGSEYIHAPAGSNPMPQKATTESASQTDRMREAERRRRIVADTAKILQLSTELKNAVDTTPAGNLSLDITRKAAEIEKLARDLKQWSTL